MSFSSASARFSGNGWLTPEDLKTHFYSEDVSAHALQIGIYNGIPAYLSQRRWNRHLLILDPIDRTSSAVSRLFANGVDSTTSLVFFDPTTHLKTKVAPYLQYTHDIIELSLAEPEHSIQYNPLAQIPLLANTTVSNHVNSARALASALAEWCSASLVSRHIALHKQIESLLLSCIFYLRDTAPESPLSGLANLLEERRKVLGLLMSSPSPLVRAYCEHLERYPRDYRDALFDALLPLTTFLKRDEIVYITERNQFTPAMLLKRPLALFFTLPSSSAETAIIQPFASLFFMQLTALLATAKLAREDERSSTLNDEESGESGDNDVRIILNGLDDLGVMPALDRWMQWWPETNYNMSFTLVTRTLATLETLYGSNGSSIFNAVGTHLVLPGAAYPDAIAYAHFCGLVPQNARDTGAIDDPSPLITSEELQSLASGKALLCPVELPPAVISLDEID